MTLFPRVQSLAIVALLATQALACGSSTSTPPRTAPADVTTAETSRQATQPELHAVTFGVTDPAKDRVRMMTPARQVATKRSFAGLHVRGLDAMFNVTLFGNFRMKKLLAGVEKGTYSVIEKRDGAILLSSVLKGQTLYFGLVELNNPGNAGTWTCEAPWSPSLKETQQGFEACMTATYLPGVPELR